MPAQISRSSPRRTNLSGFADSMGRPRSSAGSSSGMMSSRVSPGRRIPQHSTKSASSTDVHRSRASPSRRRASRSVPRCQNPGPSAAYQESWRSSRARRVARPAVMMPSQAQSGSPSPPVAGQRPAASVAHSRAARHDRQGGGMPPVLQQREHGRRRRCAGTPTGPQAIRHSVQTSEERPWISGIVISSFASGVT